MGNQGETGLKPPAEVAERLAALPGIASVTDAAEGAPVFAVGGVVRDLLLGLPPEEIRNLDLVVEGDAVAIARRLDAAAVAHDRFGTATAVVDGIEIDVAAARTETYPQPGALPEVSPATLAEDLDRRDFTINAIALPLGGTDLVDPLGGRDDLVAGVMRVLHEGSFVDDPTRALRAARYAARLGFELDPETAGLVRASDLGTVSGDRVDAELRLIAAEPKPRIAFELLNTWRLVSLPEGSGDLIDAVVELAAAAPWRQLDVREDAVLGAARVPNDRVRALAAARPERASEAVRTASGHTGEELLLARALGAEWLDRYLAEWRGVALEVTGDELLAEGIPEGPAIGRGLDAALARKLDGEISGRDEELATALAAARGD